MFLVLADSTTSLPFLRVDERLCQMVFIVNTESLFIPSVTDSSCEFVCFIFNVELLFIKYIQIRLLTFVRKILILSNKVIQEVVLNTI